MKCIVTGGAGFIGSNIVDRLIEDNHQVIIFDDLSTGKIENINPKATFHKVDISESYLARTGWYQTVMREVDVVFHTAANARVQPSIEDPVSFNNVNVTGTLNMLKSAVDAKVSRFVYSSSSSVYGNVEQLPTPESHKLNPLSPYALQKLIGEQYCKLFSDLYNLETVCLRYFNVYGERQLLDGAYCLVMGKFARQRLNGEPMTIRGDGEQRRDFTYVGDVVEANILAGFNSKIPIFQCKGEVFNIGNGDNRSVNQIADMLGDNKITVEPVIEPRETLADNNKALRVLGWKPTSKIENWIVKYKEEIGL